MNEIKNLIVQPICFFEVKGLFLVSIFPTVFRGITAVLCGEEKKNRNKILVIHDCKICKAFGHEHCPYVQEATKYFMAHVKEEYPSYSLLQRTVVPSPKWKQFTKEQSAELIKKVKDGAKPITQHS